MSSYNEDSDSITLTRGMLRDSRQVSREQSPLLRNETSDTIADQTLELPLPTAMVDSPTEIQVLHVDDDPDIVELTGIFLEKQDDQISVEGATSAVEALDRLQDGEFDCIVSDYDMPNTDGLELLEIVREQHPDIPFILFTAKGSEAIASEAISAGVTEYMQKETGSDQYEVLANRICQAVDRYRSQQRFWDALSWYHRLVEQDLAGVCIVQDEEFVYVNEYCADLFGYMQSELLGRRYEALASDGEDKHVFANLLERAQTEDCLSREAITGLRADGTELSIEVSAGSVRYGGEHGCLCILWQRNP